MKKQQQQQLVFLRHLAGKVECVIYDRWPFCWVIYYIIVVAFLYFFDFKFSTKLAWLTTLLTTTAPQPWLAIVVRLKNHHAIVEQLGICDRPAVGQFSKLNAVPLRVGGVGFPVELVARACRCPQTAVSGDV
ncbi:hypothetical protein T11_10834 [Trichinella zimbabwensis]|uniref:Uncharacterized protein n=1 Tax=Trichinella zimbabwensis TaxID=268475 RepID=A0A0V1GVH1_9BILA|nr:hypothetical protein T11_10834 [Trichinella zimbabwensis]